MVDRAEDDDAPPATDTQVELSDQNGTGPLVTGNNALSGTDEEPEETRPLDNWFDNADELTKVPKKLSKTERAEFTHAAVDKAQVQLTSEIASDVVVKTKEDGSEAIMKEDLGMDDSNTEQPQDLDIEDVQVSTSHGKSDDIYKAYEVVQRVKTPAEAKDDETDQIVNMYGKKADGSQRKKASLFDELWANEHPEEAKQEKIDAENEKKQAIAEKERQNKETIKRKKEAELKKKQDAIKVAELTKKLAADKKRKE